MSAEYTYGRLAVQHCNLIDDRGHQVAHVHGEACFLDKDHANARRLAACWNACEGISTERLEDLGRPLMKHLFGCDERAARMVKERDELLAALHLAIPALVECERAYRRIGAAVAQGEFERALKKVQTLIAKHQPPAAPTADES